MPLIPPDSSGHASSRAPNEHNRGANDNEQRPWRDGYAYPTADASFARQRVNFTCTGARSPLLPQEKPASPIPIPGLGRERDFDLSELTHEWTHVPGLEPWFSEHWVRLNEDDHVQMEWNDPTGKADSAALGAVCQKILPEVDVSSIASLVSLKSAAVQDRFDTIFKEAQATRASEDVAPPNFHTERTHTKIQKKRGPAPRVPFSELPKSESSSEDNTDMDEQAGSSLGQESSSENHTDMEEQAGSSLEQESSSEDHTDMDGQAGSSSEQESSDSEGSPVAKFFASQIKF